MGQCGNLTKMYFDLNNVCVMKLERRKRISSNSANTCNLTGIFRLRQIERGSSESESGDCLFFSV